MNRDSIEGYFRNKGFPNMMDSMTIVDEGVPVEVTGAGDLPSALQYGNHADAPSNDWEVTQIILEEFRLGRVFVVHKAMTPMLYNLHVSPLAFITGSSNHV